MKKGFLSNASAMLGVPVEAWASPVKYLFTERPKEELARFIEEINLENSEKMSYKREFEEAVDLSPSYQQLSQSRIDDQCAKNIMMLKSCEHVLEERLYAFNKFLDSLSKTRMSFDAFQTSEGSLRQALDALFVFIEQELQQARQQLSLGDLKKDLTETKNEASRKANEYQKEVAAAEADVAAAEKALQKSKETVKKLLLQKKRIEMGSFSSESVGANYFRSSSSSVKSPPPSPGLESSASLDSPIVNTHSHVSRPTAKELEKNERYQENKEQLDRMQGEVRQQIRELLRLIGVRDQVLTASRRAHQLLNKQCKGAIGSILRKLVDREREALAARTLVVDKLDAAVEKMSNVEDEQDFIESYKVEDGGELVQCSQALSILGDIVTIDNISKKETEIEASENPNVPQTPSTGRRVSSGTVPSLCSMEETTIHLSRIFSMTEWPIEVVPAESSVEDILAAFEEGILSPTDANNEDSVLKLSVQRLIQLGENLEGRKVLVNVLNQFRSKQVNVGVGFKLLAAVLWSLLTKCKNSNDVHNGKIVMILSQTFYMLVFEDDTCQKGINENHGESDMDNNQSQKEEERDENSTLSLNERGREDGEGRRMYLKELLISHVIWLDGRFWEQALWQCVLEQLVMIQLDQKWHDLEPADRLEAVTRVHDVIFSQVMAIAHSMIELGCSKASAREFVYRMCVVHQLSERQLHELIRHLNAHSNDDL